MGRPNHQAVTALEQLLYENGASIDSNLGGGNHGHLGVIMNDARYTTLTGHAFVPPINPGGTPIIPPGTTGPQIQRIQKTFENETQLFQKYRHVDNALKQQIVTAVPRMYKKALADPVLGFTNVTSRQLLHHLQRNYGRLTPLQLQENDTEFRKDYDTNEPIKNLYERVEETTNTAQTAGAPYTAPVHKFVRCCINLCAAA